jgi:hypothetical protein
MNIALLAALATSRRLEKVESSMKAPPPGGFAAEESLKLIPPEPIKESRQVRRARERAEAKLKRQLSK